MAEESGERTVAACAEALRASSRSDLAAALSAPIMLAAGFWLAQLVEVRFPPGLVPCLLLLVLSAACAAASAARSDASDVPAGLLPAAAVRLGARTGLLVFLIGGGAFLLGRAARQYAVGFGAPRLPWLAPFLPSATAVLLAFLPAVALGSLSAVLALAPPAAMPGRVRERRPETRRNRGGAAIPFATAFFAIGLVAAPVAGMIGDRPSSRARPIAVSAVGTGDGDELSHRPPGGLDAAAAGRWRITASLPVPGLSGGSAACYSPDGGLLAFSVRGGVRVFDLRAASEILSFPVPSSVEALSWSPDGRRLVCRCADDSVCVLGPASGAAVPLPVRGRLPAGSPRWDRDGEVGIYAGSHRTGVLDLESLMVRTFTEPPGDREGAGPYYLGETARCRLAVRPRIGALTAPPDSAAGDWHFDASTDLFVEDKETGRSFALAGADVEPGTAILVSPDASTIALVEGDGATVHYVGLSEEEPLGQEARLPDLPEHAPDSPLAALARSGRVGAFVCAPLVNPLNGKVVGPDPRQVRALALCDRWDPEGGTLRVAETYLPVRPGDVAGWLHHWQDRRPVLLSGAGVEAWWCPSEPATTSSRQSRGIMRWSRADLAATRCGTELRGWIGAGTPDRPPVEDVGQLARGPAAAASPPSAAVPAAASGPEPDPEPRIAAFVRAHHAKVGRGDVDGFADDYAATVDLRDKGSVGSEYVRQDQAAYLQRYERVSETIEGKVAVAPAAPGWRASYVIRSFAAKRSDGTEFERRVRITLDIEEQGGAPKIVRERAATAD